MTTRPIALPLIQISCISTESCNGAGVPHPLTNARPSVATGHLPHLFGLVAQNNGLWKLEINHDVPAVHVRSLDDTSVDAQLPVPCYDATRDRGGKHYMNYGVDLAPGNYAVVTDEMTFHVALSAISIQSEPAQLANARKIFTELIHNLGRPDSDNDMSRIYVYCAIDSANKTIVGAKGYWAKRRETVEFTPGEKGSLVLRHASILEWYDGYAGCSRAHLVFDKYTSKLNIPDDLRAIIGNGNIEHFLDLADLVMGKG